MLHVRPTVSLCDHNRIAQSTNHSVIDFLFILSCVIDCFHSIVLRKRVSNFAFYTYDCENLVSIWNHMWELVKLALLNQIIWTRFQEKSSRWWVDLGRERNDLIVCWLRKGWLGNKLISLRSVAIPFRCLFAFTSWDIGKFVS